MIKGEKEYEEKQTKKQIYSIHNGDCAMHGISACDNCKCKRQKKQPKKIVLEAKKETVAKGCTVKLSVKKMLPKGASGKIKWTSSNKRIATVNKKGVVKGKNIGKAVITASVGKAKAKCKITVYKPAKKIKLTSASSYTAKVGDTIKVSAKVISPKKGAEPIKWTSGNEAIATVNKKGVVTCKSPGTAVIKGTSGKKSVRVVVTVQAQTNANTGTPATPSAPGQPAAPSTPSKPTEPTTPETPTNPENPTTKPEDPTEPAEPEEEETAEDILISGKSNDIQWSINRSGLLKIEGTGDYDAERILDDEGENLINVSPWCDYSNIISSAEVNVREITSMAGMFYQCYNLRRVSFTGSDTSKVTDVSNMFYEADYLAVLDLSACDFRNVTNISGFLQDADEIREFRTPLHFNHDEELYWNYEWVEKTDDGKEIIHTYIPKNQDRSITLYAYEKGINRHPDEQGVLETGQTNNIVWTVNEDGLLTITGAGNYELVEYVEDEDYSYYETPWYKYRNVITAAKVSVTEITSVKGMFSDCYSLQEVDFSASDFSKVTDASDLFSYGAISTIKCPIGVNIDIALPNSNYGWYQEDNKTAPFYEMLPRGLTKSVTLNKAKASSFPEDENLLVEGKSGDLNWKIDLNGKLTITGTGNYELQDMEVYNSSLGTYTEHDMPTWAEYRNYITSAVVKVKGLTSTKNMFKMCRSMKSVNMSGTDTSKVTNMSGMFEECVSLVSANISNMDTSNVTNMSYMFYYCSLLSPDVSNFNTSKVTNMSRMFGAGKGLNLDVSNFDTSKVTNMEGMFTSCDFKTLDVSNFDTSKVTSMSSMFSGCSNVTNLDLSSFNVENVENMEWMFRNCYSLETLNTSSFTNSKVLTVDSMFYGCNALKKIDLSGFDFSSLDFEKTDMEEIDTLGLEECTALEEIKCPKNVKVTNSYNPKSQYTLPYVEGKIWIDKNENIYDVLPENLSESITLTRVDGASYVLASGTSGEIQWELRADGNLTVTGQGDFTEKYETDWGDVIDIRTIPWKGYEEKIIKATVSVTGMTDASELFSGCKNLKEVDLAEFDTSEVTTMRSMFNYCSSLTTVNLSECNTTNVTDMSSMFYNCNKLTDIDLSGFDTSNVTDMSHMFSSCYQLSGVDLSKLKTHNVTNMTGMFAYCYALESLDVSGFDTGKVTNMSYMFYYCYQLSSVDVAKFDTSKVQNTERMFDNCFRLKSLNVSNFDISNATNITGMFNGLSGLESLDMSNFKFTELAGGQNIFGNSTYSSFYQLKEIHCPVNVTLDILLPLTDSTKGWVKKNDTSAFYVTFPKNLDVSVTLVPVEEIPENAQIASGVSGGVKWDITGSTLTLAGEGDLNYEYDYSYDDNMPVRPWNQYLSLIKSVKLMTSNMTTTENLFAGYGELENIDLSEFNSKTVTNMSGMFKDCYGLHDLDISALDTKNVTDLSSMVEGCSGLKTIDVSKLDTSSVTNMSCMFEGCSELTALDVSGMDTSNVTDMSYMFGNCSGLTELNIKDLKTSKVTDMSHMFEGCSGLTSLNVNGMDTSNVINMSEMFALCSKLNNLEISGINTSKVTDMSGMFEYCTALASLNLANFNTANVTDMGTMFECCESLESLDLSSFNTQNVKNMGWMFYDCEKLKALDVSSFNTDNVTVAYYMFSYSGLEQLDISTFDFSSLEDSEYYSSSIFGQKLAKIKTPKNVAIDIVLSNDGSVWKDEAGNQYYELPKDKAESITLTKVE